MTLPKLVSMQEKNIQSFWLCDRRGGQGNYQLISTDQKKISWTLLYLKVLVLT